MSRNLPDFASMPTVVVQSAGLRPKSSRGVPMSRRACIVLATSLMVLMLTAASAAAYVPAPGPVFNNPYSGSVAVRTRILNHVLGAIRHSPKGSTIQFAIYSFDRPDLGDALVAAHRRGVHVQMVLNDNTISKQTQRLQGIFGDDPTKSSFVVICHGSCRGGFGNQHMKFYLFSHTGDVRNVVMAGSSNLTGFAARNQFNDLYTVNRAPGMRKLYARIFNQLKFDKAVAHPFVTGTTGIYRSYFYPHPNTTKSNDPVMRRLNGVRCHAVGGTGYKGDTVLRILMYGWVGKRGLYLADKVASLKKSGCRVNVILSNGGQSVAGHLRHAGVAVRTADMRKRSDGTFARFTHEKWMSLDGNFQGRGTKIVWTGSENWSDIATHNDEDVVQVPRAHAYNAYLSNFEFIWKNHSRKTGVKYGE